MKKNSLLKAIGIMFVLFLLISWVVPTGYFSESGFVSDAIMPIGLLDLIRYPLITATSSVFILSALVILIIGGVYGVLNKTGAYQKLVESIAKKFKDEGNVFLVITILVLALLSSITGQTLILFTIVPFFAAVILLLGYSKFTALLATIGSILVGNLASTYGFNISGYNTFLTNNINDSILAKIVLFALLVLSLIFFVIKLSKGDKKVKAEEIPLYEKGVKTDKKSTSIIILGIITFVVLLVGLYNWSETFKITFFEDVYNSIMEFSFNGYAIFKNVIGSIYPMGAWTNYEVCLVLVIFTLIIGKMYGLKLNEICSSFIDGVKKIVPVAVYAVIANLIFLLMNSTENGYTFYGTINNTILGLTNGFNVFTYSLTSFIGSFLYNDYPYLLSTLYTPIISLFDNFQMITVITQSIHGLVQIIAPTSVILVAGLTYFDIPYTKWLKNIWKFVLSALAIIVVIIVFMALFI